MIGFRGGCSIPQNRYFLESQIYSTEITKLYSKANHHEKTQRIKVVFDSGSLQRDQEPYPKKWGQIYGEKSPAHQYADKHQPTGL